MSIEEILRIALDSAVKSNEVIMKGDNRDPKKQIGLHSLYEDSVKMLRAIRNHSVKDVFPKELYEHRSPNQTDKELSLIHI